MSTIKKLYMYFKSHILSTKKKKKCTCISNKVLSKKRSVGEF